MKIDQNKVDLFVKSVIQDVLRYEDKCYMYYERLSSLHNIAVRLILYTPKNISFYGASDDEFLYIKGRLNSYGMIRWIHNYLPNQEHQTVTKIEESPRYNRR